MTKNQNREDNFTPIVVGDCVAFQPWDSRPNIPLSGQSGKVRAITEDGYAMVEFLSQPKKMHKILVEDLQLLFKEEDDIQPDSDSVSLLDVMTEEDHELGGMSRAQLIAHKILAQEYDPGLDRNINKLIN